MRWAADAVDASYEAGYEAGLNGLVSTEDFQATVDVWQYLCLEGAALYRQGELSQARLEQTQEATPGEASSGGLPGDPFDRAFRDAMAEMGQQYIPGTWAFVRHDHAPLWAAVHQPGEALSAACRAGQRGEVSMQTFGKVAKAWQRLVIAALSIYRQHKAQNAGPKA